VQQQRRIAELRLSGAARLADWLVKANFTACGPLAPPAPPAAAKLDAESVIDPASVVDLTAFVEAQGKLHWDAPPGDWTIPRIGHTPVGTQNRPAPTAASVWSATNTAAQPWITTSSNSSASCCRRCGP